VPGSGFTLFGARMLPDYALVSVGAELHINTHWTALAKFEGEFTGSSQIKERQRG